MTAGVGGFSGRRKKLFVAVYITQIEWAGLHAPIIISLEA
jgi:hypothetical protein